MKGRKSYTKPVSELSGYKTFVSPHSTESGRPRGPILPIRQDDDEEAHDINMGHTYENKPGPIPGRKLWRTFGLPGEQYGSPWKDFNQRRTITSSEEEDMDKQEIFKKIVSEIKNMTPEEMYEEALRMKEEQGDDWDPEEESLLEGLRSVVYDELDQVEDDTPVEMDWGSDTEEDWSEEVPEDEEILAYKRRNKRQKSHSRSERNRRRRALGFMGRLKAKLYGRKYRKRNKAQLKSTRRSRKRQNRKRIGPKVKNLPSRTKKRSTKSKRRKRASLSHFDQVRLLRHGSAEESFGSPDLTEEEFLRLQRHGFE